MADLVLGTVRAAPWRFWTARGLLRAVVDRLEAERERWALWLPVGMGLGIGLYFSLKDEPPPLLGGGLAVLFLGLTVLLGRSVHPRASALAALLLPIGVIAAGFGLAQLETWRVAAPVLDHMLGVVEVEGKVIDLEPMPDGTRVTLAPEAIAGLALLPRLIRIKLRTAPALAIGDRLTTKAALMPPPGPALPGGFDFQRYAWFRGIGAVGYGVGSASVVPAQPSGLAGRIKALREAMSARIRAGLPGPDGAIAAAVITGERGAVPAQVNQDYRDSGLAHLLVIAGLHMTLVTGFVFFAVRAVLALIPAVALRYPIKKWAALAALVVAVLYLVVSGAAVPTQRAFVMVALGLLAILIDRLQVSMTGVAWAAGAVLALDPAALIGVSFQMSFAAVVGLIAFYETFGAVLAGYRSGSGPVRRVGLHLAGIAITTIVATLGTAAFSVYHFNRFAVFSVLANVLAVPLAGLWVMPWAFASCLLMPFGLERVGLVPMGWGLDAIAWIAGWTASLPDAVLDLPSMPDWGLAAIALGGLWLALWRTRWRRWGALPMALGALSLLTVTPPDVLVSGDGKLVALRVDGHYLLSSETAERTAAEAWVRAAGGATSARLPVPGSSAGPVRCDALGCLWHVGGQIIAIDRDPAAAEEDCRRAALVVALVPLRRACRTTTRVIDHTDLRENGAAAAWLGPPLRVATADALRGRRPWVLRPRRWTGGNDRADATPASALHE